MSKDTIHRPERFLVLAEKLVEDQSYDELARARTAVGRAYYASFLNIRDKLESLNLSIDPGRAHKEVLVAVNARNPRIGGMLSTLYSSRIDADYRMKSSVNLKVARRCVSISRTLIQLIPSLK